MRELTPPIMRTKNVAVRKTPNVKNEHSMVISTNRRRATMPGARREYYGRALPVWPPNDASATGHGPDNDEAPPDLNEFWVT